MHMSDTKYNPEGCICIMEGIRGDNICKHVRKVNAAEKEHYCVWKYIPIFGKDIWVNGSTFLDALVEGHPKGGWSDFKQAVSQKHFFVMCQRVLWNFESTCGEA